MASALRTRALRLRTLQPFRLSSSLTFPAARHLRNINITRTYKTTPITPTNQHRSHQLRPYSMSTGSAKPTADLLVEELQDLYEVATDEFEIATDSTDNGTIYAASDRESARDAANQLLAVYHLYTGKVGDHMDGIGMGGSTTEGSPVVETAHNSEGVTNEVRDEVKRRVGQRIRELRNAVVQLEERAREE
ncbi:hypothetical protein PENDEC_c002G00658 [Penicillium decumbens]|uniref:Uncharacterized protein n=1 Tax=Penicillium decumbens TaxID=69771 RepID=A0A1V6PKY7_PENDC|nr:hypothetical protein PENDEC_c002G00658 [Penicillium decumbens]